MYKVEVIAKNDTSYMIVVKREDQNVATTKLESRQNQLIITELYCHKQFESRGLVNGMINKTFEFAVSLNLSIIAVGDLVYLPFASELKKFGFQQRTNKRSEECLWVKIL